MDNEHQWTRDELRRSMELLKERERQVMTLRFGLLDEQDHTLEEVGKTLKVTRERVRQIEERAWSKLKKAGPDGRLAHSSNRSETEIREIGAHSCAVCGSLSARGLPLLTALRSAIVGSPLLPPLLAAE